MPASRGETSLEEPQEPKAIIALRRCLQVILTKRQKLLHHQGMGPIKESGSLIDGFQHLSIFLLYTCLILHFSSAIKDALIAVNSWKQVLATPTTIH
jgi:hypothetical protein